MLWTRLKFIWLYATHLQTDADPPIELIFKFIDTLDKKDTKQHIKRFGQMPVSKIIYNEKLPVRLQVKENDYPKGSFGAEFKKWLGNDEYIVDLFTVSLVPFRATRKKNTNFNKYAEATMLQHDLIHFFNGYDTSPIGEVCVLSFNLAQEWRKSYATILYASFFMALRNTFLPSKYPKGTPLYRIIVASPVYVYLKLAYESYQRGKKSKWFLEIDWTSKLNTPLEEVKKELNLEKKPAYWHKVKPVWSILYKHYRKVSKRALKKKAEDVKHNAWTKKWSAIFKKMP